MLEKIISGGQTGIDRMALDMAKGLGIATGGTAHKYWLTEKGPDPSLREYGLVECEQFGYPPRTWKNVVDSDATLWLGGGTDSAGYYRTRADCKKAGKEFIENHTADQLAALLIDRKIRVLNVAGPRGSKLTPEASADSFLILYSALTQIIKRNTSAPVSSIDQSAGES